METPNLNNLKNELRAEVEIKTNDLKIPPAAMAWFEQVEHPVIAAALEQFCLTRVRPVEVRVATVKAAGKTMEELLLSGKNELGQAVRCRLAVREA